MRLAWATDLVAGQSGLPRETLPPPNKTNKTRFQRKTQGNCFDVLCSTVIGQGDPMIDKEERRGSAKHTVGIPLWLFLFPFLSSRGGSGHAHMSIFCPPFREESENFFDGYHTEKRK